MLPQLLKNHGNGRFDWLYRMGVHEAYHLDARNRLIHWLCIPLELWSVLKLGTLIQFMGLNLGFVLFLAASAVYIAADVVMGMAMAFFLFILLCVCVYLDLGPVWAEAMLAVVVFSASFLVQTKVGHDVFQAGVDDTRQNLEELKQSKNPIPILLIFFYHLVEIFFALGFRKDLRAQVEAFRDLEATKIADS